MLPEFIWTLLSGNRAVSSLALIVALLVLRLLAARLVRGQAVILSQDRRAWLSRIRNLTVVVGILGLVLIWLPALHAFALSITAVALAIVIATKELLLCLSGTVLRAINRPFEIGDWVEIGELHGEVVDESMLATRLEEIRGPGSHPEYTGNTLTVPNSIFLTTPVRNRNFLRQWRFLDVTVVLEPDVDMTTRLAAIERDAVALQEPDAAAGREFTATVERRTGVDIPDPEPRVTIGTTDIGKTRISVTLLCPTPRGHDVERALNTAVLGHYWAARREV